MSMTLGQRLKAIRKAQPGKMNQEDFAKSLGLTRMAYSMYELARVVPSESVQRLICTTYHVNPQYLTGASNEMFDQQDEDERLIDAAITSGDPLVKALLTGIVKRPDGWRALAESILTCADYLREQGIELDPENEKE